MEDVGVGTAGIDDIVDADNDAASSRSPQRSWAAPVVQTLRLTSGPSTQRDEPPSAPLN